jgi:hypothetical protein
MKKNQVTLALVTLVASSAVFAGNAVLNVEGEIQINGTTVIDSNGAFIGSAAGSVESKTINLADYRAANGTYKYKISWGLDDEFCIVTETIANNTVSATEECEFGGATYNYSWSWVDNGDGTHDSSYSDGNETYSVTYRLTDLSDPISTVTYGDTFVSLTKEEVISSSANTDEEVGDSYIYTDQVGYYGDIDQLEVVGDFVLNDCVIIGLYDGEPDILCRGLGYIGLNTEYMELPGLSQASAVSIQHSAVSSLDKLDRYRAINAERRKAHQ